MLLVIVGAGASYDSAPSKHPTDSRYRDLANRPPLADQLFGDRQYFGEVMNKYPRCLDVVTRLRHIPAQSSVERELKKLQDEASAYPERHQQLAAIRYYLQEVLWVCTDQWLNETQRVSNYITLVDDIKRWKKPGEKVCFVTFNYDTLLDKALEHHGYPFTELSGYVARDLMLVKLHGSVNWGRIVSTPLDELLSLNRKVLAQKLVERYATLEISKRYVLVGDFPPTTYDKWGVFPALAIPVEAKLDFECPPEHINALKAFIPQVKKILTIGWRGTEQLFLELLRKGLGTVGRELMVVGGTQRDSEATAANLNKAGLTGQFSCVPAGFTDFIVNGFGTGFLSK